MVYFRTHFRQKTMGVKLPKLAHLTNFEKNISSDRDFSGLSEYHKIIAIGQTEQKLWPFKDAYTHNYGIACMCIDCLLPCPTQIEPTSPYDVVKYYLEHPLESEGAVGVGLCVVPVRVVLQNCCGSDVTAMLDMTQPSAQSGAGSHKR